MVPPRLLAAVVLAVVTGCGPLHARDGEPGAGATGGEDTAPTADTFAPAPSRDSRREPVADPGPAPTPVGGGSGPSATVPPPGRERPAGTEDPHSSAVQEYVAALAASSDPGRMREGLAEAAEDSPARTYLLHHATVARAWADGDNPQADAEVDRTDAGYRLCRDTAEEGYWGRDRDTDRHCVELTDFAHDDGRVARFRVDGDDPSGALIEGGDSRVGAGGVEATVVTAYRPVNRSVLVVTLDISADDSADIGLPSAVYRTLDGERRNAELTAGRYELDSGASTSAALYFPDSHPGGSVVFTGCLEECSAFLKVALPVS
ncbi:hypothetical protein [Nocardiopsis lucentensis]|uniref:hypothetical protein n=1 Tax=Nocardiopsis lucentensis TaxID=53441 RepID=UPI00034B5067|nr:hypothetical protein [Nocardiopsis lucentensis]